MRKIIGTGFFSLLLFVSNANALDFGVGVKAGTLGAGVDLSVALTRTINARIALTSVDIDSQSERITIGDESNQGELDARLDASYGANALLFDWYVFDGTFHLTAGMVKNNGRADLTGTLLDDFVIDGQAVATDDINGNIGGSVSLGDSYQPYLGIGWGRKASEDSGLSLSVEIGVALLDPKVDLNASVNTGGTNGLSQQELDDRLNAAQRDAEADLDELELFPVLSVGLNYAF